MLTIGQLAAYAGVTVRAVRHYHQVGPLPEPTRDRSGYLTYDAGDVVCLIRILAEAGVPLARELSEDAYIALMDSFAADAHPVVERLQDLLPSAAGAGGAAWSGPRTLQPGGEHARSRRLSPEAHAGLEVGQRAAGVDGRAAVAVIL